MITPKITSKGLMVEFKSIYMGDEYPPSPETYEGILIALHKQGGKAIVLAVTDHLDAETRSNLAKSFERLKDKHLQEPNLTILEGYFYDIVIRDEDELPIVHKRVNHIPEEYDFVIPWVLRQQLNT